MPRSRRFRHVMLATLIGGALVIGLAQVAPGLILFHPGDPIEADRMNHNFAVLDGRIDEVVAAVAGVEGTVGPAGPQGIQGPPGPPGADADLTAHFGTTSFGGDGRGGAECTLGDVQLSAATFGYGMVADGRLLPISSNSALFSLLGTMYGGDGRTTFALPDLRDVAPKSRNGQALNYYLCTAGIYPSRN